MNDPFVSQGMDLGLLYHVGIAVRDLDEAVKRYSEAFNIREWRGMESEMTPPPLWHGKPVQGARLKWAYANTEWPWLEFIQPVGDAEFAVSEFLRERGEGVHHLGYFVDDIRAALRQAEEQGITGNFVSVQAAPDGSAQGIAYLNPKTTHGVSIELVSAGIRDILTKFVHSGVWQM